MTLSGTRFGDLQFGPSEVLFFKDGLIGFPELNEFVLLSHKDNSPFRWLQSVREPALAFLCVLPQHFVPEFNPKLRNDVVLELGLKASTDRYVLCTASIPKGKPEEMTINLAAPIVVNANTQTALQFVLEDEAYTIRHRVFPEGQKAVEKVAA